MRLFVKMLAEAAKAPCTVAFHNILIKASCIWMSNSNICHVQLHTPNCLPEMGLFNPFTVLSLPYVIHWWQRGVLYTLYKPTVSLSHPPHHASQRTW